MSHATTSGDNIIIVPILGDYSEWGDRRIGPAMP
jgi:hypothetical protein